MGRLGPASITLAIMLTTVASQSRAGQKDATPPSEAISYAPTQDRNVRVSVGAVLMQGQKGYLPKDRNWLQLHVSVADIGARPVDLTSIRARLAGGTVLASVGSGEELAKPPSAGAVMGRTLGTGVAAQAVGMFIFPPAAILINAFGMMGLGHESWSKRMKRIDASLLNMQTIAPGTSVEGDVYVPALRDQTALVVFYTVDGRSETLTLSRLSAAPALAGPVIASPPAPKEKAR